jgi:hypothetical protein
MTDVFAYAVTGDDYFGIVDLTTGLSLRSATWGSVSRGSPSDPEEHFTGASSWPRLIAGR